MPDSEQPSSSDGARSSAPEMASSSYATSAKTAREAAIRACAKENLAFIKCAQGNHLFSGRSCDELYNTFWTCVKENGGESPSSSVFTVSAVTQAITNFFQGSGANPEKQSK